MESLRQQHQMIRFQPILSYFVALDEKGPGWGKKIHLLFCFLLLTLLHIRIFVSPESILVCKEGACVIWGLSSVTACWWCPVPVLGPGTVTVHVSTSFQGTIPYRRFYQMSSI